MRTIYVEHHYPRKIAAEALRLARAAKPDAGAGTIYSAATAWARAHHLGAAHTILHFHRFTFETIAAKLAG